MKSSRRWISTLALAATAAMGVCTANAAEKPNILVIFGDDIGQTNISAYGQGVVGYQTPKKG